MADLYDEDDDSIDCNFSNRAQSAFDWLNDGTDWTWKGLAEAFARQYGVDDLMELQAAIDAVICEVDE